MTWGQLELADGASSADDVTRVVSERKIEQLRRAQEAGLLDPAWDPLDILILISRIAMSWAAHADLIPADEKEREKFLADHRAAVVAAIERLFPAAR